MPMPVLKPPEFARPKLPVPVLKMPIAGARVEEPVFPLPGEQPDVVAARVEAADPGGRCRWPDADVVVTGIREADVVAAGVGKPRLSLPEFAKPMLLPKPRLSSPRFAN